MLEEAGRPVRLAFDGLPLVREIFAMFDADADGKLSKDEYEAYLRGTGAWGTGWYTDSDDQWEESWQQECEQMQSNTEGISRAGFESILYGKYRSWGQAPADLDKCRKAQDMETEPEPEPEPEPQQGKEA
eukprot:COSAG04_NODE_8017_length_1034_cov_0.980749_1_plen_130_part_00